MNFTADPPIRFIPETVGWAQRMYDRRQSDFASFQNFSREALLLPKPENAENSKGGVTPVVVRRFNLLSEFENGWPNPPARSFSVAPPGLADVFWLSGTHPSKGWAIVDRPCRD